MGKETGWPLFWVNLIFHAMNTVIFLTLGTLTAKLVSNGMIGLDAGRLKFTLIYTALTLGVILVSLQPFLAEIKNALTSRAEKE